MRRIHTALDEGRSATNCVYLTLFVIIFQNVATVNSICSKSTPRLSVSHTCTLVLSLCEGDGRRWWHLLRGLKSRGGHLSALLC